jgi:tetratricopeptide (TPR) repeat protein
VTRNLFDKEQIQVTKPHVLKGSSIKKEDASHYVVSLTVGVEPWKIWIKAVDAANQPIKKVAAYVRKKGHSQPSPAVETDDDGLVQVEVSDLTDSIELSNYGYEPTTVSAYRPQNTPKTVVMQKASRIKVFLNVRNEAGDEIEQANIYVGKNAAPLPLEEFQGKDYDLGTYQMQISPLDAHYRPWKGPMLVEDDDGDGKFTFNITLFEDMIKQAEDAEESGDYARAAQLYSQISNENPEHIDTWFKAGQIYGDKLKDYARAVEMFQKIIKEDEQYALAYYNKGVYHYSAKEYPEAIEAFENVITYQKNLGDQYENIMYRTRFFLAAGSYNFSNKAGLPDIEVQNYRNKAKRYSQEFIDNVPDSYKEKNEHKKWMGAINQITSAIE